jgi:hypothetical protein
MTMVGIARRKTGTHLILGLSNLGHALDARVGKDILVISAAR